jgi:N-acetylglucosaminyldiphosphoundecaprenol N-acetyl-beta-D-mannosaminyltransferase
MQTADTPVRNRVRMFGLSVDNLTMAQTLEAIAGFVDSRAVHQHVAVNVDKVVKAHRDPKLRAIVNACDLISPDGQPLVWASRLLGRPLKERVAGIDLMVRLFALAEERGFRVYLLGARPEVIREVVARLERDHPRLIVAGARDGYWAAAEEEAVAGAIETARPDLLFVAIPSPHKERFLAAWKDRIRAPFVMGVGGSFDVYGGRIPRAPRWMRRLGMEWLYRLAREPGKMWRRYLVDDLAFGPILLGEMWRTLRLSRRRKRMIARRTGRAGPPTEGPPK